MACAASAGTTTPAAQAPPATYAARSRLMTLPSASVAAVSARHGSSHVARPAAPLRAPATSAAGTTTASTTSVRRSSSASPAAGVAATRS